MNNTKNKALITAPLLLSLLFLPITLLAATGISYSSSIQEVENEIDRIYQQRFTSKYNNHGFKQLGSVLPSINKDMDSSIFWLPEKIQQDNKNRQKILKHFDNKDPLIKNVLDDPIAKDPEHNPFHSLIRAIQELTGINIGKKLDLISYNEPIKETNEIEEEINNE